MVNTEPTPKYVSLAEAAKYAGCSQRLLRRRIAAGDLVSYLLGGRRFVTLAGIDQMMERNRDRQPKRGRGIRPSSTTTPDGASERTESSSEKVLTPSQDEQPSPAPRNSAEEHKSHPSSKPDSTSNLEERQPSHEPSQLAAKCARRLVRQLTSLRGQTALRGRTRCARPR